MYTLTGYEYWDYIGPFNRKKINSIEINIVIGASFNLIVWGQACFHLHYLLTVKIASSHSKQLQLHPPVINLAFKM